MVFATSPLPLDFYNSKAWLSSLVNYYCDERRYMSREVLLKPLSILTKSIERVVAIYGDFPKPIYSGLRQSVDPLFAPEEYEDKVYKKLLRICDEEKREDLRPVAEAFHYIRLMFQQDETFLNTHFKEEIGKVAQPNHEQQLKYFAKMVQMITKIHTLQVAKMIETRK